MENPPAITKRYLRYQFQRGYRAGTSWKGAVADGEALNLRIANAKLAADKSRELKTQSYLDAMDAAEKEARAKAESQEWAARERESWKRYADEARAKPESGQ